MSLIKDASEILKTSRFPVVLTGAGISNESGIPTFRGEDGLWKNYRPEDLATPAAFQRSPELVWEWYNWRRSMILQKSPNSGHYALVDLQKKFHDLPIITQNVDNLHNTSGALNVIEMHGNIFQSRCLNCSEIFTDNSFESNSPRCKKCQGRLRPNVIWFGEGLDYKIMNKISGYLSSCDVLLVIGTSGNVYPAAGFASEVFDKGGKVIEINPNTVLPFALGLKGKSGEILPELVSLLKNISDKKRI